MYNETISIRCKQCQKILVFSPKPEYFGKVINVKCSNCGNWVRFKLMMSGNNDVYEKNGTLIDSSSNNKVLRLEVMGNETTFKQCFNVTMDNVTIGRKNNDGPAYRSDIEIVTADKYMSRIHCSLQRKKNGRFVIKDIGKSNKTVLNGKELGYMEEFYLNEGDMIKLGQTIIRVMFVSK